MRGFRLGITVPEQPPILVAALREGMLRLAGPRRRRRDHQLAVGRRREDGRAARRRRTRRSWRASSCSRSTTRARRDRSASARSRRTSTCRSTPRSTSGSAAATSCKDLWRPGRKVTARPRPSRSPTRVVDELIVWGTPEKCKEHIARYMENGVTTPAPGAVLRPRPAPRRHPGAGPLTSISAPARTNGGRRRHRSRDRRGRGAGRVGPASATHGVYRTAVMICGNRADAEEAVQDAFLRVWRFRTRSRR